MKSVHICDTDLQLLKQKYPKNFDEVLKKIEAHFPIQYLIGNVDFFDCTLLVDSRVFIPRFETEFLVSKTIDWMKKMKLENPRILELGTGSGCISIALKKHFLCEIQAVDISKDALDVAQQNAKNNQVDITFLQADMLDIPFEDYDVVISNPPYISLKEQVGLETIYEPQISLYASKDGLYYYEEILKKIQKTLHKPKLIAFEIGMNQGKDILSFGSKYLPTYRCVIEKDLAQKDRYIFFM